MKYKLDSLTNLIAQKDIGKICYLLTCNDVTFKVYEFYKMDMIDINKYFDLLIKAVDLVYETDKNKITKNIYSPLIYIFGYYSPYTLEKNNESHKFFINKIMNLPNYFIDENVLHLLANGNKTEIREIILKNHFSKPTNFVGTAQKINYSLMRYCKFYDVMILNYDDFIKVCGYIDKESFKEYILKKIPNEKINIFVERIILTNDIDFLRSVCEIFTIQFNIDSLIISCKEFINFNILEFILMRKIIPTKECLDTLLSEKYKNAHEQLVKIKLLFEFGCIPTTKDIVTIFKYGIQIEDFEKFDITFNSEMFKYCCKYKIINKYTKKFKPTQKDFQDLFLERDLRKREIDKYLSKKLVFDEICLQNACLVKYNEKIINIILNNGVCSNSQCIINYIGFPDEEINNKKTSSEIVKYVTKNYRYLHYLIDTLLPKLKKNEL
jgi:hypothetical protein